MSDNRNNNHGFAHPGAAGQRTAGGGSSWGDRRQSGAVGITGYGNSQSLGGGDYQRSTGQRYNSGNLLLC